ncbi:hypothetical protein [Ferruginibacter sp.]|nr:hypothetical protein [Ferruginibacter sp.]
MKLYLFKKNVFNCKHATLLSLKNEEGKISFIEKIKLHYHLLYCKYCKRFIKQSAVINKAGNDTAESLFTNPSHLLSAKTKENIQRRIDTTGQ